MPSPEPVRVAVVGASGVGRFHVRELARAGAVVTAVLGRSLESARRTAAELEGATGARPRALASFDELLASGPDAVCIATPHATHFEYALRALTSGLFVFCEKPLLWEDGLTAEGAKPLLAELAAAGAADRLAVNTSNATFLEPLAARGLLPASPRSFSFHLSTLGGDRGEEIGVDLLPHGLSLLLALAPAAPLQDVAARAEPHRFEASLRAAGLAAHFLLEEHPEGRRRLAFAVDGLQVERVQEGLGGNYRVSLDVGDERIPVPDPFAVYLGRFLAAVRGAGPLPVSFETSARNLLAMLALLESARARRSGPKP